MDRRLFLATAMAAGAGTLTARAQTTPPPPPAAPTRIRGTIVALAGNTLTVNSRDGQKVEITLADPVTVATVKKVELSAIEANTYIGTATRTGADGKMTAIEVLVFPEAMKGANEGHYPWDLQPESMMTNATVSTVASASDGQTVKLEYKGGGTQTIKVKPAHPS